LNDEREWPIFSPC